jgi:prephenate dehydrogenase (NADP+)
MGAAWAANKQFPWEIPRYLGGIENVKINVMMRIYFNKWHVYAGLAIMNPSARDQIRQYATSVTELFKLMLRGQRDEFTRRIKDAGAAVFGTSFSDRSSPNSRDLLLDDKVLDRFSLGELPPERVRNSHLSLLAMVDCWSKLGIVPYNHMICSTPVNITFLSNPQHYSPNTVTTIHELSDTELGLTLNLQLFRMWLGITEYLFRTPGLLDETIETAIDDVTFRGDDLEFTFAARVSIPFSLCYLSLFENEANSVCRIGVSESIFAPLTHIERSLRRYNSTSLRDSLRPRRLATR